LAALVPLATPF